MKMEEWGEANESSAHPSYLQDVRAIVVGEDLERFRNGRPATFATTDRLDGSNRA